MILPEWALDVKKSTPDEERQLYGYPIPDFYHLEPKRVNKQGKGRNEAINYVVERFSYKNPGLVSAEILIRAVDHALMSILIKRKIDLTKRTVHLVLTNSGFREKSQVFMHLNKRNSPGQTVWNLLEKFAQSNRDLDYRFMELEIVYK